MNSEASSITTFFGSDYFSHQVKGQKIYSPTPYRGYSAVEEEFKRYEIFIGQIPGFVSDKELLDLLEIIGSIYKVRCMIDTNGNSRGFAFSTFLNAQSAEEAIVFLHNFEIRPNLKLSVHKSINNCRLYISGVPIDLPDDLIQKELEKYVSEVVQVISQPCTKMIAANNGKYIFVEFQTHSAAAKARKILKVPGHLVWDKPIFVEWADPIPEVNKSIMNRVTKLFINNLPQDLAEYEFARLIKQYVNIASVTKIYKAFNYSFIHFAQRADAEQAFDNLQGIYIWGQPISVTWGRPKRYSKDVRIRSVPQHFCMSVPPLTRRMIMQKKIASNAINVMNEGC